MCLELVKGLCMLCMSACMLFVSVCVSACMYLYVLVCICECLGLARGLRCVYVRASRACIM